MALVIKDRVRQTSTTAGTGTITLSGSVTGYQDFTVIGTGNTTYYTIADQSGSNWEVGLGTYTAPNQLARTTVYESSNSNALVNFGSNIKDVFVTLPAEAASGGGVVSVTATSPVQSTGGTTPVISLPAATTSTSGYLTSTDWNTFNNKQAAGSYLTTVTADSPLTGSGTSASHLSMPVATTSDNGYLSSTDWTTFNNKQATLVSGTNIKTVNSTSLLGSGDVSVGTVTSVGGTGTVSGISLSGTVTNTGSLTLGGSLNLSSPPAIGGTTPNTITGTTVTATNTITLPEKVNVNDIYGVIEMQDGGDSYDYLSLYGTDIYGNFYPVHFPQGLVITGGVFGSNAPIGSTGLFSYGNGTISGYISLFEPSNTNTVKIRANTSLTSPYNLTLPTTAGSNNQVLNTDGSGNLSWVNLNAPSIYTTASSQNSTSTTLANITGLTATLTANTTYRVDCFVTFQSAATTTGINFGFTSPAGTTCMLEVVVPITNTAAASQLRTIFPNNSSTNTGNVLGTGVSTANSNHTARFSGIIKVGGTGGTFAARYATEVASSAITIPAGSTMVIQQIS